jgi:hypothetical protein
MTYNSDDDELTISLSIVNDFADFFQNSYVISQPTELEMLMQNPILLINEIDKEAVYKGLRKVKDKSTAGTDVIPAFLLRDYANVFVYSLTALFNLSLKTSTYPVSWKKSYTQERQQIRSKKLSFYFANFLRSWKLCSTVLF